MTKWQYKTEVFNGFYADKIGKTLNLQGEDGWELVTVVAERLDDDDGPWYTMIFKRPISN